MSRKLPSLRGFYRQCKMGLGATKASVSHNIGLKWKIMKRHFKSHGNGECRGDETRKKKKRQTGREERASE